MKPFLLPALVIAMGGYMVLTAQSQFAPPREALEHADSEDILTVVERRGTSRSGRRVEFHLRNGAVWSYASYLPRYSAVESLGEGPLVAIALRADPRSRHDFIRGIDQHSIYEIDLAGVPLVSYEEAAGAQRRNSIGLEIAGAVFILGGVGLTVLFVRKGSGRRGR